MKVHDASQIAADAIEALNAALAAGKSEALTQYLAMQARFHRYSFGNVMMILSQKPDATHVAGFHTWRTKGRFVKKGEKGIVILAPMLLKPRGEGDVESSEAVETSVATNAQRSRPCLTDAHWWAATPCRLRMYGDSDSARSAEPPTTDPSDRT